MESPPLVSVIVPTYNRPHFLREALFSLESQSLTDWEAIIVDDASLPSGEAMRIAAQHNRTRVITHDLNQGGAAAKNTGIGAARGRLLTFLDDDDQYDPLYLSKAVDIFEEHRDIDVLFMGVNWFGKDALKSKEAHAHSLARTLAQAPGELVEPNLVRWSGLSLLDALLNRVSMPFQRTVLRRSRLDQIGLYNTDCLLWDSEWALRASMRARCALLMEPLYFQRSDGQGNFSREEHKHRQTLSAAEMVMYLYQHMLDSDPAEAHPLLRNGASRNMQALAHYISTQGDLTGALRTWWRAQCIKPSLSALRFPFAATVRSLKKTPW